MKRLADQSTKEKLEFYKEKFERIRDGYANLDDYDIDILSMPLIKFYAASQLSVALKKKIYSKNFIERPAYVIDLIELSKEEVLKMPGIGSVKIQRLQEKLNIYNLNFNVVFNKEEKNKVINYALRKEE